MDGLESDSFLYEVDEPGFMNYHLMLQKSGINLAVEVQAVIKIPLFTVRVLALSIQWVALGFLKTQQYQGSRPGALSLFVEGQIPQTLLAFDLFFSSKTRGHHFASRYIFPTIGVITNDCKCRGKYTYQFIWYGRHAIFPWMFHEDFLNFNSRSFSQLNSSIFEAFPGRLYSFVMCNVNSSCFWYHQPNSPVTSRGFNRLSYSTKRLLRESLARRGFFFFGSPGEKIFRSERWVKVVGPQ